MNVLIFETGLTLCKYRLNNLERLCRGNGLIASDNSNLMSEGQRGREYQSLTAVKEREEMGRSGSCGSVASER